MDGTYYPTSMTDSNPDSWFSVSKANKTVHVYHLWISIPNTDPYSDQKHVDVSVQDSTGTFTYDTTENRDDKGDSYYNVTITVAGHTIYARYYYKNEKDIKIAYERRYPDTDEIYFVTFAKGTK